MAFVSNLDEKNKQKGADSATNIKEQLKTKPIYLKTYIDKSKEKHEAALKEWAKAYCYH